MWQKNLIFKRKLTGAPKYIYQRSKVELFCIRKLGWGTEKPHNLSFMTWRHSKDAFYSKQTEVHSPNTCRGKKNCDFTFWNEYRHIFHKYLLKMKIFQQLICELIRNKMVETLVENYMWHQVLVLSRVWLCDFVDFSSPGSSVHGILQARIPDWVAIPFSSGFSWPRGWTCISCIAGKFFTDKPHAT